MSSFQLNKTKLLNDLKLQYNVSRMLNQFQQQSFLLDQKN